jgi:orotidine-5'-phosphate decarboxylase
MRASWLDKVANASTHTCTIVAGIDPVPQEMPTLFQSPSSSPGHFLIDYIESILKAVVDICKIVKFQSAYFEALGVNGVICLRQAIILAREMGFTIILDAKRGDIGSTAAAYAQAYLLPKSSGGSDLEVDCLTVNPFLGKDTLDPFVTAANRHGKGIFVLARTSNPGSGWVQTCRRDGLTASERIARYVASTFDETTAAHNLQPVGIVVGATFPEAARRMREILPRAIFLVPGIGAQGGDPASLSQFVGQAKGSVLVPTSRALVRLSETPSSSKEFEAAVRSNAQHMLERITQ